MFSPNSFTVALASVVTVGLSTFAYFTSRRNKRRLYRQSEITPQAERVLVIGGTSGVGRAVAELYAQRGARVCVVGRRRDLIQEFVLGHDLDRWGKNSEVVEGRRMGVWADFSQQTDMCCVRTVLESTWGGVDTVIIAAGVSAVRPFMALAGVDASAKGDAWAHPSFDCLKKGKEIVMEAASGNFMGPLVCALTLIPLLHNTSHSPSFALVSSVAALIPAPTRALYGSTKAASLMLYQALAIEHPEINFSFILPGTIEGNFRASAVDIEEGERARGQTSEGLKREDVARRIMQALDWREKFVWMPSWYRWAHALYWIWPSFIERKASRKYNFIA